MSLINRKHLCPVFVALLLFTTNALAMDEAPENPIANPAATVEFGHARFSILTPQLIRMEYSSTHTFEDKASLAIINRQLPAPVFTQKKLGNLLSITTANLQLKYTDDGQEFNDKNLQVEILSEHKKIASWYPGKTDSQNLKGTMRTLDQANAWDYESKLESGLISRSGWALVDDSQNNLFDGNKDWNWVTPRTNKNIDWYLFGYGNDYKKAIYDFTQIAGKIPLPPKYAFGYWWSRYWIYNDKEMRDLVKNMRDFQIPLDVLIVDMDWHETYGFSSSNLTKDSQDQWVGWTGYTWNKKLFPEPEKFIEWTNNQHLKTALNLHPASGVPTMEEKYSEFAKAYDFKNTKEYIPFNMSDKKWATTYFDTLLKPMQDWGIDFWWLDWQQFLQDKNIPSLSNTWWLNYTFFTNMEKTGKRPMIFHRWGGLGNHRYPIGFSGDAMTNWETLDFETYFTATAANVGYAYWSHDIGGHISNDKPTDGELYLRWIQFGTLSPILRTHASKISLIERRPWMFPQYFFAMRDAIKLRYSLAPYIYANAHNTYDTGIALVHPLYYDYPSAPQAYSYKSQYFFGNDMIAAPVTNPIDKATQLAERKIWLPNGEWFELSSGTRLTGTAEITRHYALNEIPLFAKAGSIIPMNPDVQNLQQKPDHLILSFVPGGKGGSTELYEDDNDSTAYQKNHFSKRKITSQQLNEKSLKITFEPSQGNYAGMPQEQKFDLKFLNRSLPSSIKVNGEIQAISSEFSTDDLASIVHLPAIGAQQRVEITLEFSTSFNEQDKLFNGNKGFLSRVTKATETLKYASALTDWGGTLPNEVFMTGNIVNELLYHPENSLVYMQQLNTYKKSMAKVLLSIPNVGKETTEPLTHFLELDTTK